MVRGLIHEKDVRVTELNRGEHDARFLPPGELHDGREVVVPGEAELPELRANLLGLVRPALGLEVLPEEVLHRIFVHAQDVHEVLRVPPDPELVRPSRVPSRRFQIPGEKVHERGFARAVGADDAHARAHVDA